MEKLKRVENDATEKNLAHSLLATGKHQQKKVLNK